MSDTRCFHCLIDNHTEPGDGNPGCLCMYPNCGCLELRKAIGEIPEPAHTVQELREMEG